MKNKRAISVAVNFLLILIVFGGVYLLFKYNVPYYTVMHAVATALITLIITPRLTVKGKYPHEKYRVAWIWTPLFMKNKK